MTAAWAGSESPTKRVKADIVLNMFFFMVKMIFFGFFTTLLAERHLKVK